MEKYLNFLKNLIQEKGKAWVAVQLNVKNTNTIDSWLGRSMIPSKYLDTLSDLNERSL